MASDNVTPITKKTEEERFLSMLVLSGMRDRLMAMGIRLKEGTAAAIAFLENCTLSAEASQDDAETAFNIARGELAAVADLLYHVEDKTALSEGTLSNAAGLIDRLSNELDRAFQSTLQRAIRAEVSTPNEP
jgi:hypothetical protein